MSVTQQESLFSSSMSIIDADVLSVSAAKERFEELQQDGTIKYDCSFNDNIWQTTDQYSNVGLYFKISPFTYKKYKLLIGLPYKTFLDCIKAYTISLFGKVVLTSIENTLLDIAHLLEKDPEEVCGEMSDLKLYSPNRLYDFLQLFITDETYEGLDRLSGALDAYSDINAGADTGTNQRELVDFESYFEFDDIVNDFWNSDLSKEDRYFYYPLYIWWKFTTVIPQRPCELLVTERNCLFLDKNGRYNFKFRKNQIKGSAHGDLKYTLCDSYVSKPLPIPDYLGKVIEEYIKETDQFDPTDIDTLFVTDPHYKKWGHSKHSDSRYLTYTNLNTILRYFFREIVQDKYGYTIRYGDQPINHENRELGYIHLGDTRHLAFINLMQEGASPVTAMLLGGHKGIEMASHYYSNVVPLLECLTYRQYRKMIGGDTEFKISKKRDYPVSAVSTPLSDGGTCFSKEYHNGSISDCKIVSGPDGEIGYCPECSFYRKDRLSYFSGDDIYKRHIENGYKDLLLITQSFMEGKGNFENIQEALLRLNSSTYSYKAYLMEKYAHEDREEN